MENESGKREIVAAILITPGQDEGGKRKLSIIFSVIYYARKHRIREESVIVGKSNCSVTDSKMTTLGSIDRVEQNITKAPVKAVKVLHRMIYGQEGDRQNRKRLRQFKGFRFDVDTDEYRNKILAFEDLQKNELVTVCILLCLDYTGEKTDLATRIINGLCDLEVIKEAARKEEDEEENDELENDDDDSEAENGRQDDNNGGQPPAGKADCQFSFHFRDIENTVR